MSFSWKICGYLLLLSTVTLAMVNPPVPGRHIFWFEYGEWRSCSSLCGGGITRREAWCVGSQATDRTYDLATCPSAVPLAALEQPCNTDPCDVYVVYVGEWSECSKSCGEGTAWRETACLRLSDTTQVPAEHCGSQVCNDSRVDREYVGSTAD